MAGKTPEIPFAYGELLSVTGGEDGAYVLWFRDYTGVIRAVPIDASNHENVKILKGEFQIKRATEGQARKKKGSLPPIGAATGDTTTVEKK